jgi:hypothetical protein
LELKDKIMKSEKLMVGSLGLLAGILFLLSLAGAADSATSLISFNKQSSIEINPPDQVLLRGKPPYPTTDTYSDYITITSNVLWNLNIWGSNDGCMVSKNDILHNPLNIKYTGSDSSIISPLPNPLVLTGTDQRYVTGDVCSLEQIPTEFIQKFEKKDKPGYYEIALHWTAVAAI